MEEQLIRAIKTEEQYKIILQQIKSLWSCAENSPEADLLEVFSILADGIVFQFEFNEKI